MTNSSSDIDRLSRQVSQLTSSFDFWNAWMIYGLIAAAIAAAWVGLTTRLAVVRAKQLAAQQGQLDAAKGRQLEAELAEKDRNLQSAKAEAKERADSLELRAKMAETQIETAKADAARATQSAAEANRSAENERAERVKLEAQVAPRRLTPQQQRAIVSSLTPYRGHSVLVASYALDSEGAILANQIEEVLQAAGLIVQNGIASRQPLGNFQLGVHVTGGDQLLVTTLRTAISPYLLTAPANAPQPTGWEMRTGPTDSSSAEILVGVKPLR